MRFLIFLIFISNFSYADFRKRAYQFQRDDYSEDDVRIEIEFGQSLASRLLTKFPLHANVTIQNYVSILGSGIAAMIGRADLKFHFAVVESNEINAFACPGGYIFLTTGLLKIIQNEAQLVGVIAHEIHHVNDRHVIKKLKLKGKGSSLAGLGKVIGGTSSSITMTLKKLGDEAMDILFQSGLQKSEEIDSDRYALLVMDSTGYNVLTYRDLLLGIDKPLGNQDITSLSKTHPSIKDRLKLVNEFPDNNRHQHQGQERFKAHVKF